MYKVVRKSEAKGRPVGETKSVLEYVTKETSPAVSLVIVKNSGDWGEVVSKYNRIYFVLEGSLKLKFTDGEEVTLGPWDSCFVSVGEKYNFAGDCQVITVDSPAHGG